VAAMGILLSRHHHRRIVRPRLGQREDHAATGAGDMRTGRALDEARDRALEVLEL
jgi:hypothetical protein